MSATTKAPVIKVGTLTKDLDWDPKGHTVEFFVRDGMLQCCDHNVVDYYHVDANGNDAGMWIHEALEQWAKEQGCYWEWENAECISLCN